MITRRFTLKPEHSLALRKVELEMRMSRSNLTFMLDQHLNDPDDSYLDSDEFNELYERYLMAFNEWERVQNAMIDIITGTHRSSRTYLYENGFLYVTISANEKIPASPEYNTEYTPVKEKFISYTDLIAKLYPKPVDPDAKGKDRILSRTVTFQVTDKCNLACTYCYQINKGTRRMTMDDAKLFIDKLLTGEDGFKEYINPDISPAIVVEFIGGEPFLEIDLIDEIVDYFRLRVIQLRHPWMEKFCVSICSNGVLYTDPRVQKFLQKNKDNISFSVTLDGNKELHDKCRVFPDGGGSYDIAEAATQDWMSRGYYMGSKITISQENLPYIYDALMHIVGLGYDEIHANCVYEAFWTEKDAGKLYELMKKFSDFMLSDKKYRDLDCSLYTRNLGTPKKADDLQNWCGGTGSMLSMDPDGWLYPCIRYMESSLGADQKPMRIGNVHTGLATCKEHQNCVECLNVIDRRSQSTDDCFYCPIAEGCSWCSAFNYQTYGTADKRVTRICPMHKGRVLANVYHWNNYYKKYGVADHFDLWVPRQWAEPIIGKEEYEKLVNLVKSMGGYVNESEEQIRNYQGSEKGHAN
jgi:uncharacterized protein